MTNPTNITRNINLNKPMFSFKKSYSSFFRFRQYILFTRLLQSFIHYSIVDSGKGRSSLNELSIVSLNPNPSALPRIISLFSLDFGNYVLFIFSDLVKNFQISSSPALLLLVVVTGYFWSLLVCCLLITRIIQLV